MLRRRLTLAVLACGLLAARDSAPIIFAPDSISTAGYESHPAFRPDGKTLLFVRRNRDFSGWRIYQSTRSAGKWSTPDAVGFVGDGADADPQFSPDGRRVYFISSRTAPGKASKDIDIWVVERMGLGWSVPERLPAPINSPGAEWFPRMQRDGTLYFGSDRPGGLGATDIYRAIPNGDGWRVINLGAPVNSAGDEYEFELSPNGTLGILMAARDPGTGGDLYRTRRSGGVWSPPKPLSDAVNTSGLEVGPLITRDGKTLYFSSRRGEARLGDIYSLPMASVW